MIRAGSSVMIHVSSPPRLLQSLAAMAQAAFHTMGDGLPARDAASWTEEKLMILDAYLTAFAKACQRAGGWYGLDLFAGTGLNWSTIRDAPIAGSALMPSGCGYSMRPQRTTSSCLDL